MRKAFLFTYIVALSEVMLFLFLGNTRADTLPSAPVFEQVAIVPFDIQPQPFEGAPLHSNQDKILRQLSEEATKQAERTLIHHKIAGTVARVAASGAASGQIIVTGVVRLPISLPRDVIGLRAESRRGRFATGKVIVLDTVGKIIAEREVELVWGDAFWTRGGKYRRNKPLDDVLAHFARKTADRAIQQLKSRLTEVRESECETGGQYGEAMNHSDHQSAQKRRNQ